MTREELVADVCQMTAADRGVVDALVRSNWPMHSTFTPTQALLMATLVERKKESRCNPQA